MSRQDAYHIDPFLAEFSDPETESAYRVFTRDARLRDTRLAISLAAVFYLGFAVLDYLVLGTGQDFRADFLVRLGVCLAGLAAALLAQRYWRALVNGLLPSLVVGLGMAAFLAITLKRPYDAGWHGMSMMLMLLGTYVFIPNRFLPALVIAVLSSLAFLWLLVERFHLPLTHAANLIALLGVLNLLGAMTAHRISRMAREEYRQAAILREANQALRREVDERQRLEVELREMVSRDDLTGILNRRHFFTLAERHLAQAWTGGQVLSLILIDIDYFKPLNVTYGHTRGDEVLATLVRVCRDRLRRGDLFARLGGEEFALLLPGQDKDAAYLLAEELRGEVQRTPVPVADSALYFTVSIGVAEWRPEETITILLRRADEALSVAKYRGRNRVEVSRGGGGA